MTNLGGCRYPGSDSFFNESSFCHSVASNSVTPWTVSCQASLSIGCSRQEYWSGLPFPPPGDLPDPGMELLSRALAGAYEGTWEYH